MPIVQGKYEFLIFHIFSFNYSIQILIFCLVPLLISTWIGTKEINDDTGVLQKIKHF